MARPHNRSVAAVAEWSPGAVRLFVAASKDLRTGNTLSECVRTTNVKSVVVAVHQRAVLVRSMLLPPARKEDLERVAAIQLHQSLGLDPNDYVIAVHAGEGATSGGKRCTVAAVKKETLRKAFADSREAGLEDVEVVPLAVASLLASKANHLDPCAVVQRSNGTLSIDLVDGGLLRYSRAVSGTEISEEIAAEVARTSSVAGVPIAPILSSTDTANAAVVDRLSPLEHLVKPSSLRSEFLFELPETAKEAEVRGQKLAVMRAAVACVAALALGGYAAFSRWPQTSNQTESAAKATALTQTKKTASGVIQESATEVTTGTLMETALHPAQSFSDVVSALAAAAPKDTWFSGVIVSRGQTFTVRGQMTSGKDVADFERQLSKQARFKGVKIVSASKGQVGKRTYVEFVLTGYPLGLSTIHYDAGGQG